MQQNVGNFIRFVIPANNNKRVIEVIILSFMLINKTEVSTLTKLARIITHQWICSTRFVTDLSRLGQLSHKI